MNDSGKDQVFPESRTTLGTTNSSSGQSCEEALPVPGSDAYFQKFRPEITRLFERWRAAFAAEAGGDGDPLIIQSPWGLYLTDDVRFESAGIRDIPTEIGHLQRLRVLNFKDEPGIERFPTEIGALSGCLRFLSAWNHSLTHLPTEIGQLKKLRELDVWNGHLQELPTEIGNLGSRLNELTVDGNELQALPTEIGRLGRLQKLYVDQNNLTVIPTELSQLTRLVILDLRHNHLDHLPAQIGNLCCLEQLRLNGNRLRQLPGGISRLHSLEHLCINRNFLTRFPTAVLRCPKLRDLDLSFNQITRIPRQEIQDALSPLQQLDLRHNQIRRIPRQVTACFSLRQFNMANNRLKMIPFFFGDWIEGKLQRLPPSQDPQQHLHVKLYENPVICPSFGCRLHRSSSSSRTLGGFIQALRREEVQCALLVFHFLHRQSRCCANAKSTLTPQFQQLPWAIYVNVCQRLKHE